MTSGIGIRYANSVITMPPTVAVGIEAGKSLPSRRLLRLADHRPFDLQDALPSNLHFKVVVFVGDFRTEGDVHRIEKASKQLRRTLDGLPHEYVDIIVVAKSVNDATVFSDFPADLRPLWTRCVSAIGPDLSLIVLQRICGRERDSRSGKRIRILRYRRMRRCSGGEARRTRRYRLRVG